VNEPPKQKPTTTTNSKIARSTDPAIKAAWKAAPHPEPRAEDRLLALAIRLLPASISKDPWCNIIKDDKDL